MSDITERLRESADNWLQEVQSRYDAADEIERLEHELQDRNGTINRLQHELAAAQAELAVLREQEPIATVRIQMTGGNAGIAWHAVPTEDAPLMRDGDLLYAQPTPPSEPDGWQLVPEDPTPAMLDALRTGSRKDWPSDELCRVRYAALLTAAPKPEHKT